MRTHLLMYVCVIGAVIGQARGGGGFSQTDPVGDTRVIQLLPHEVARTEENQVAGARRPDITAVRAHLVQRAGVPSADLNQLFSAQSFTTNPHSLYPEEIIEALQGVYLSIDMTLEGLINPPGPYHNHLFDPTLYGDNPVFGLMEIDIFGPYTGGDSIRPHFSVHNLCTRLGGVVPILRPNSQDPRRMPYDLLESVIGLNVPAGIGAFSNSPQTQFGGQDLQLTLSAQQNLYASAPYLPMFDAIFVEDGSSGLIPRTDERFGEGDRWILQGRFLCRAIGYAAHPWLWNISPVGVEMYCPLLNMEFKHDLATDKTTIRVLLPVINQGLDAEYDFLDDNEASLLEMFWALQAHVAHPINFPTGAPEDQMVALFYNNISIQEHFDPAKYKL